MCRHRARTGLRLKLGGNAVLFFIYEKKKRKAKACFVEFV